MSPPTPTTKANWNASSVNRLPDSAFLYVQQGGEIDGEGKTKPRALRHFPVYDEDGLLDLPRLRVALARIPQSAPEWLSDVDKVRLTEQAKRMLSDAVKTVHARAKGLPDWAHDYVAHADTYEAAGISGDAVYKAWKGDGMVGKRTAELLRSLTHQSKERTSKRVTKATEKLLRAKVAAHNALTPPPRFRVRVGMLKVAYQRGLGAYAKSQRPSVKSAPQWGFARVAAALEYCRTGVLHHPGYVEDFDFLPKAITKDEMGVGDLAAGGRLESSQNYRSLTFAGLPVVLDRPKGFVQRKYDDAGKLLWEREYKNDYGYIPSTLGGDSEELDVYLGPNEQAPNAYWVLQVTEDGSFDEYKVVLGANDEAEARAIYLAHTPEKYLGRVFETPVNVLHCVLGLEREDLLKALEPTYYFVACPDGTLATAHPWTSLSLPADVEDGDETDATVPPTGPLLLSATAHAEMAGALAAVAKLVPSTCTKVVTPLAPDVKAPPGDETTLAFFSDPDPFNAEGEIASSLPENMKALHELPETTKNVAKLGAVGGVFKVKGVPGRVWVATYPLPAAARSVVEPLDPELVSWEPGRAPREDPSVAFMAALDAFAKAMDEQMSLDDAEEEEAIDKEALRGAGGKFAGSTDGNNAGGAPPGGGGGAGTGGGGGGVVPPAGGGGGTGASPQLQNMTHVGQAGGFAKPGNSAHNNTVAWAGVKAGETGKPVYLTASPSAVHTGGLRLSYKAPKSGPHSVVYPGGTIVNKALSEDFDAVYAAALQDADQVEDITLAELSPKAAQERIDDAYAKYHEAVNMSASDLEAWAESDCSKLASLDRAPIERNLRLLRKAKDDWTLADARDANRTVSFVARMRGAEQGEPAREGCPSKRDISLKNWAYDPGKKSAAAKAEASEHVVELVATGDAMYAVTKLLRTMKWMGDVGTSRALYVESTHVGGPALICGFDGDGAARIPTLTIDGEEVTPTRDDLEAYEERQAAAFKEEQAAAKAETMPTLPDDSALAAEGGGSLRTVNFGGIPVVISRPKGFVQHKLDDAGQVIYERTYQNDYGYLAGTNGGQGDGIGVFLGPEVRRPDLVAWWVTQVNDGGGFDEYKVLLGFLDEESARACYVAHMPERYLGSMESMPIEKLRALLGLPLLTLDPTTKADTEQAKAAVGTILRKSEDHRYTLGIVLVPDEPDLQGDVYNKATIRRAADIFITDYQNTAVQHNVKPGEIQAFRDENPDLYNGKIRIVDSIVIPDEMGDVMVAGRLVKAGTWLIGHRWIDDDLWADVKAGKYTGLSMGGFARRVALDGSPMSPS